ncbi:MAG: hypothetical protein ASARMPREDX12_006946 [Alectoria sarmentosa]|nr:MAG: hypothetical protein ASARMPREDX12_006946 [Alectoria sarmentosa]
MFKKILKAVLAASLASHVQAALLGSSFGVPGDDVTYDYVIVGGGNAGLTVATRLVEQNAGTVGIIEAGSFYEISNGNLSQVPATDGFFAGKSLKDSQPLIDWNYATTPQKGAFNQKIHYARGKALGGSSARNFMVYQRGTVGSYQNWADAVGDQSYTWKNFLPYFQKSVTFTPPDTSLLSANYTPQYDAEAAAGGNKGPLSVTFSHYAQAFATWAIKGFQQIGISEIPGFLSGELIGQAVSTFTINATTMQRDSSETSFLAQGLKNPALKVHPFTLAKQILFDANKKATGVRVDTAGDSYVLSASKEVILAAGTFNSPQLLMVSGVGPAATLQGLNIPVVANRPAVGQGMQDNLFYDIAYRVNGITLTALSNNPAFAAEQAELYNDKAAGLYTSPNTDVIAWEKIPASLRQNWSNETKRALAAYPADWPEVEYLSLPSYLGDMQNLSSPGPLDGFNYASLGAVLVAPRSRGNLTITSADTSIAPLINPNYLTEQSDVDIMVASFKRIRQFYATKAMQSFVIGDEYYPGKEVATDEQIEDHIRKNFNTIWHATSTCAMGGINDPEAVVDTRARVIGVEGLRVVDASAFPLLPPGHPMSTVYALAEKIACNISGKC